MGEYMSINNLKVADNREILERPATFIGKIREGLQGLLEPSIVNFRNRSNRIFEINVDAVNKKQYRMRDFMYASFFDGPHIILINPHTHCDGMHGCVDIKDFSTFYRNFHYCQDGESRSFLFTGEDSLALLPVELTESEKDLYVSQRGFNVLDMQRIQERLTSEYINEKEKSNSF